MPRIVDTVANAGRRVVSDYTYSQSALTTDNFILLIESLCNQMGWTTVTSTTTSGHPDRTVRCVQSPYWNELGPIPSYYKAQMRMRIFATSNTIIRFRFANGDGTVSSAAGDFTQLNTSGVYRLNACPYQFTIKKISAAGYSLIAGVPHIRRTLQDAGQLVDFVYAHSGGFLTGMYAGGGHAFVYINSAPMTQTFDDVGSGFSNAGAPRIKCVTGHGGGTLKIANPIDDATLTNAGLWFPWFLPAQIGLPKNWNDAQNVFYPGWFWDMIMSTEAPPSTQQTMSFDNGQQYYSMTETNAAGSTAVGTLWQRSM